MNVPMDWDTERSCSTDIGFDGEVEDETGNLEQRREKISR